MNTRCHVDLETGRPLRRDVKVGDYLMDAGADQNGDNDNSDNKRYDASLSQSSSEIEVLAAGVEAQLQSFMSLHRGQ